MSLPPPFVLKTDRPTLTSDGTYIMFTKPIKDIDSAISFFKEKMLINDQIPSANNGLYSWLLKEEGLIMIPVESEQEIGSVHANLWSWTPTLGKVLAAGELKKEGTKIEYNLQSGSFMKPNLKTKADQLRFIQRANKAFRTLGLYPIFLKCKPDGIVECDIPVEDLSGKMILDTATIITPDVDIFLYRQFFTEEPLDVPLTPRTVAQLNNALGPKKAGRRRHTRKRRSLNKRRKN